MELLLFRPEEFERQYNCSRLKVDDVPLAKRVDVLNGLILLTLFYTMELLYIPCLVSIWRRMADSSCYKLLFYVGVTDMLVLWVPGFFSGYFALTGAVFCSHPKLIYILGTFGMGLWAAESFAELTLAIDRCLELSFPEIAEKLFHGRRILLWLLVGTVYALFWTFGTRPVLFSSIFCAWFFNPYAGYLEDTDNMYHNYVHSVHDTFMAFAFPLVYLLLGLRLMWMSRHTSAAAPSQRSVSQKMMFLQVALISGFNCYACLLYVAMQYIQIGEGVILMAHYGWLFIHGIPPFIYLTINHTIRGDCRKLVAGLLFRMAMNITANGPSSIGGQTNGNRSGGFRQRQQTISEAGANRIGPV